jgi:hypothetical protein
MDAENTKTLYLTKAFRGFLDFAVMSVNYDIEDFMSDAEIMLQRG